MNNTIIMFNQLFQVINQFNTKLFTFLNNDSIFEKSFDINKIFVQSGDI